MKNSVLDDGDSAYLFLPLAHAFAILIQFVVFDLGTTLAYWSRDPQKIIPDLVEVNPTYFPSVPRIFEKIYTMATRRRPTARSSTRRWSVGVKVRTARAAGEEVPGRAADAFDRRRGGALQERARAVRRPRSGSASRARRRSPPRSSSSSTPAACR